MKSFKCLRCLLQDSAQSPRWPISGTRRALSTSPRSQANIKKPHSITAAKMGLLDPEDPEAMDENDMETIKNYQEIRQYTPIQQEAINLAHKALVENAHRVSRPQKIRPRTDAGRPMILQYEDEPDPETGKRIAIREDFAKLDPFLDPEDYREMLRRNRGLGEQAPDFSSLEFKNEDEMGADLRVWLDNLLEPNREAEQNGGDPLAAFNREVEEGKYTNDQAGLRSFHNDRSERARKRLKDRPISDKEWFNYLKDESLVKGDPIATKQALTALTPEIGDWTDPGYRFPEANEELPDQLRLRQQVLLTKDELRKVMLKPLVSHRVVNQTHMGKIGSMYCLTIAGNGNGLLGIGEGKAVEPEDARKQADLRAIRNMEPIHRYENRTIFGEVHGKVGATELVLMSRPPGKHSCFATPCFLPFR